MRAAFGLLLLCLGFALSHDVFAEPTRLSESGGDENVSNRRRLLQRDAPSTLHLFGTHMLEQDRPTGSRLSDHADHSSAGMPL